MTAPGDIRTVWSSFGPAKWRERFRGDLSLVCGRAPRSASKPAALNALELMTIILEDRRFFRHCGVDLRSLLREASRTLTFRKHGGASTIDMQFVRTVTGFRQNTLARKAYEIALAMALQARCDKRTVLSSYLACAYFGSGLIGADAAARKVFAKSAAALDIEEAAFVAAMLAYPRPINGSPKWQARVRRRAAYGLSVYVANKQKLVSRYDIAFQS